MKEKDPGIVPVPFMLTPTSEHEYKHGKPILLTDCEIASILDSLQDYVPTTPDGEMAVNNLWRKLLSLWNTEPPYES